MRVFLSSVMDDHLRDARQAVVDALDRVPYLSTWAFEYTPPSTENASDAYLRQVREAHLVIWLAGRDVTQPVINEIEEALAHNRPLIVIRFGEVTRTVECEQLLTRVRDRVKYGDAKDLDELAGALELTIGDVIVRALRNEPSLSRLALIEQVGRASRARCVRRWQTPGLPQEEALRLADDPAIGAGPPEVLPDSEQPVVLLSGDMGAGKSLCAERFLQNAIEHLVNDGGAPVPVWMRSKQAQHGLASCVTAACDGVGDPRIQGATIVVDGLDEVGADIGASLLGEAQELCLTWPTTTVLLTSRPMSSLAKVEERRSMPALTDDQAWEVANIGAGEELHMAMRHTLPQPIRKSMSRPLFALLYGIWRRRNPRGHPRSQGDLLAFLGEEAERRVGRNARETLISLAVASVRRELGAVPAGDIGTPEQVRDLLDSGIVSQVPGGVAPGLPVLAQWFAAQALLEGRITVNELLETPDDIDLWRYPLALAVAASGSFIRANELLAPLMRDMPSFAFTVIAESLPAVSLAGIPAPPWREAGEQMRSALQTIVDGVGDLCEILPVGEDRRLLPLAVACGGEHVDFAFWHGEEQRDDLFQLTQADLNSLGVPSWGMSAIGQGSAWAWRWARDQFAQQLKQMVKYRAFPLNDCTAWQNEQTWAAAVALSGDSGLRTTELAIQPILDRIERIVASADAYDVDQVFFGDQNRFNANKLRETLRQLLENGVDTINSPLPRSDQVPSGGGGMVGFYFSEDQLVRLATAIYSDALGIYECLVSTWFTALATRMGLRAKLPVQFVGRIHTARDLSTPMSGIPYIDGYFEPLPHGGTSRIDFTISTENLPYTAVQELYQRTIQLRPHTARWINVTTGGSPFNLTDIEAASKLAYEWLWHDLTQLRIVTGSKPFS